MKPDISASPSSKPKFAKQPKPNIASAAMRTLPVWAVALIFGLVAALVAMGIGLAVVLQNTPASAPVAQPTVTVVPTAATKPQGILVQPPIVIPTETAPVPTRVPAFNPKPAANALTNTLGVAPLFAPTYNPNDGKPVFICGVDAFASYLTLLQMQVSGKDVAHGFHLGIIPFDLNEAYQLSEQDSSDLLLSGKADCQLDTVDTVASASQGVITAIVDESAGGDGIWARELGSIYDLKGKRIAYIKDSSSEFFMRYVLDVAEISANDVTLVPADSIDDVMRLFNEGKADAVSAWEPQLSQAELSGGAPFLTSEQLRVIVDTIMVGRKAIQERPEVVQAFHDAWFDTLKAQTENFDLAAEQIAAWGGNDWSAISTDNAANDFRDQLKLIAQADLVDNLTVMSNLAPIMNQLNVSRKVWSEVTQVPTDSLSSLVDPQFVLRAASNAQLRTQSTPINNSFSLGTTPILTPTAIAKTNAQTTTTTITSNTAIITITAPLAAAKPNATADDATTLAVLPCRKFTFLPDSAELTQDSRRVLDLCVVPTLQQRAGLLLRVKGSAAWPGPAGTYTAQQVQEVAAARAQAIADYLISQNIDPARLVVEGVMPPKEHWETMDSIKQAEDRYVQMTLISGGR